MIKMYSVPENMRLSKNFILSEFACKDGSKTINVDGLLMMILQTLRDKLGKPVSISSGYRTPSYNASCGGMDNSEHTKGKAADIQVAGVAPIDLAYAVVKVAKDLGLLRGIGVYPTFVHVDVGDYIGYWYQDHNGKKTFYKSLDDIKKIVVKR
jgi:uncharacterized protein YcbK (DUF882 family)